jgi:hypothetical protein
MYCSVDFRSKVNTVSYLYRRVVSLFTYNNAHQCFGSFLVTIYSLIIINDSQLLLTASLT